MASEAAKSDFGLQGGIGTLGLKTYNFQRSKKNGRLE